MLARVSILRLFLFSFWTLAVSLVLAQDPNQVLREAMNLHQAGDFQGAIEKYDFLIQNYPGIADIHSNLGAVYVSQGNTAKAIENYEIALRLGNGSDPAAIRFNLALAYYKSARFEESANQLEQVLQAQPQHSNAAMLLADTRLRKGDWSGVIHTLTPFEEQLSEDKAFIYLLGTALIREGKVVEGEVLIDKILSQGDSAEAHFLLGTAYIMVMDYEGAIEEFEEALKLNPDLPGLNATYAKALRAIGRIDEGSKYFKRELNLDPFNYEALLLTGVYLYKQEQKYDEALEYFDQALKIRPGSLDARFQIGLINILQGNTDKALEIVEGVVEEAPEFLEGHVTLTSLYYRLKRREDAQRHREIAERIRAERDAESAKTQQQAEELQRRLAEKKAKGEAP